MISYLFFVTLENRDQSLDFVWSPFHGALSLSLPLILFLGLIAGFIWGSVIMWSNTLYLRTDKRELKKKLAAIEQQIELQKRETEKAAKTAVIQAAQSSAANVRIAAPEIL